MTKRDARRDTKGGDTGVREAELGEKWERRARWGCWAKWGERNEEGRRQRELGGEQQRLQSVREKR